MATAGATAPDTAVISAGFPCSALAAPLAAPFLFTAAGVAFFFVVFARGFAFPAGSGFPFSSRGGPGFLSRVVGAMVVQMCSVLSLILSAVQPVLRLDEQADA